MKTRRLVYESGAAKDSLRSKTVALAASRGEFGCGNLRGYRGAEKVDFAAERRLPGLKPSFIEGTYAALKGPLFHGDRHVRVFPETLKP